MDRSRNKKNKKLIKKQKKNTAIISLPHEIIENILSRIPVKYLCRFKSVSKKWNSTISDPTFAEIHLQQSKNNPSRNLLAWEESRESEGFHVTKLQNNKFRLVSVEEHPWEDGLVSTSVSCYCDGLYLKRSNKDKQTYFIWNPSTRTYKMLHCPYPLDFDYRSVILYGICYDTLMKDYKVVIADKRHYAVFSCRNDEWSEVKEMIDFSCTYCDSLAGVSFNGSFYWTLQNHDQVHKLEVIRFDCRDEELKKVPKLELQVENVYHFYLASLGGHLCLFSIRHLLEYQIQMEVMEVKIMKKDDEDDSWTEFKVLPQWPCDRFESGSFLCLINQNEIIVEVDRKECYHLYDLSNNTSVEIRKTRHRKYSNPIPYVENLFLL